MVGAPSPRKYEYGAWKGLEIHSVLEEKDPDPLLLYRLGVWNEKVRYFKHFWSTEERIYSNGHMGAMALAGGNRGRQKTRGPA